MKTYISSSLLIASMVTGCLSPSGAFCMSLRECVLSAIDNNPGLSSESHLISAYDADAIKKQATTLPYLSSQLQGYEVNGIPVTPWVPSGVFQPENGVGRRGAHWAPIGIESVGVTYPIAYQGSLFGLNDPPAVAAAREQVTQEKLVAMLREEKVVCDIVSDFVRAISYRQQIAIYDRIVEILHRELEIVGEQVRLGRKLPQDDEVLRGELSAFEYARSVAQENSDNFAGDLTNMVRGAVKGAEDREIQIDNALPKLTPLPPLPLFLDRVMPGHPALQVQTSRSEVARQQLRVDEANRWPTASFTTSFGAAQDLDYFSGSSTHLRPTAFESYLTLTIPLYDFGGRRAAVRESRENLLAEKQIARQLELDIRSSIAQEYGEILQNAALVFKLHSQLEKDQANLDLATAQAAVDKADQMTVLSADATTLQDTLDIQAAEMSERLKYAELQNLSGGKWNWAP